MDSEEEKSKGNNSDAVEEIQEREIPVVSGMKVVW